MKERRAVMIDTIVLRLHRVRKYRNVLRIMDQFNTKGFSTPLGKISGSELKCNKR
jgi:hypothetical protein